MKTMFKYIEVKKYHDDTVIYRIDVSEKTERSISKIMSGMDINLNHLEYYTFNRISETKLKPIK